MNSAQVPLRYRLSAMLASIILALLMVEAGARVRQYIRYGSAANTVFKTAVDPGSGLLIPAPGSSTRTIHINSRGFRSPELQQPKPPGRIRLAFIGSSTTFCAEVSSNEATWPQLVWKQLQASYSDVQFDYVNAGVVGYLVNTSLRNLEYRVKPLSPDVIVIYEGINDFSIDTRELARQQGLYSQEQMEVSDPLARYSLAWYLIEKKAQMLVREKKASSAAGRLVFDPSALSGGFHDKLRRLVQAAQEVAPVVALATFSQQVRRGQPPEQQLRACGSTLYYNPFLSVEGILSGMEEYNRVVRTVAQETNAVLIEGEDQIPGDAQHFNDSVHFKDAGAVLMAHRVIQALEKSDAFSRLVESHKARPAALSNSSNATGRTRSAGQRN
jgi:lysophospholipase L1-like esterase